MSTGNPFDYQDPRLYGMYRPFTPFQMSPASMLPAEMQGMIGPGMNMVGSMALSSLAGMMAGPNSMAIGPGPESVAYRLRQLENARQFQQYQQFSTEFDASQFQNLVRGGFHLSGMPWGPAQLEMSQQASQLVSSFMPMLSQFAPGFVDLMGGNVGSQTVMGQYMFQGGRYRVDPISGQFRTSPETSAMMTQDVFQNLFNRESRVTRQLSAGEMGQLFNSLQAAGVIPATLTDPKGALSQYEDVFRRTVGEFDTTDLEGSALQRLQSAQNDLMQGGLTSREENRNLLRTVPGLRDEFLQNVDAQRITSTLEQYEGAVDVMREIFGAAGEPNAPIPKLMKALESLAGGNLANIDPTSFERQMRQIQSLADMTGTGPQQLTQIAQFGSGLAQGYGLDAGFTQDLTAEALAFRSGRMRMGLPAMWGASSLADQTMNFERAMADTLASPLGRQLGLSQRLQATGVDFAPGSELAAWQQAVQSGQSQYSFDGAQRSVLQNTGNFFDMIQGSTDTDLSRTVLTTMMGQSNINQQYLEQSDAAGGLVGLRRADLLTRASASGAAIAAPYAEGSDLTSRQLAREIMSIAVDAPPSVQADPQQRTEYVRQQLTNRGYNVPSEVIATIIGQLDTTARRDPTLPGGFSDVVAMYSQTSTRNRGVGRLRGEAEGVFREALSSQGVSNPVRQLIDSIASAGPGDDIKSVLSESFNIALPDIEVGDAKIANQLYQEIQNTQQIHSQITDLLSEGFDPENNRQMQEYRGLLEKLRSQEAVVESAAREVESISRDLGITRGPMGTDPTSAIDLIRGMGLGMYRDEQGRWVQHGATGDYDKDYLSVSSSRDARWNQVMRSVSDRSFFSRLGEGGRDAIQRMTESRSVFSKLADRLAGGDVNALITRALTDPESIPVEYRDTIQKALGQATTAYNDFADAALIAQQGSGAFAPGDEYQDIIQRATKIGVEQGFGDIELRGGTRSKVWSMDQVNEMVANDQVSLTAYGSFLEKLLPGEFTPKMTRGAYESIQNQQPSSDTERQRIIQDLMKSPKSEVLTSFLQNITTKELEKKDIDDVLGRVSEEDAELQSMLQYITTASTEFGGHLRTKLRDIDYAPLESVETPEQLRQALQSTLTEQEFTRLQKTTSMADQLMEIGTLQLNVNNLTIEMSEDGQATAEAEVDSVTNSDAEGVQ